MFSFAGGYTSVKLVCSTCNIVLDKQQCNYHRGRPHSCQICKERIQYGCLKCDKMYRSRVGLQEHLCNLSNRPAKYECPKCNYKTNRKSHIDKHIHLAHYDNFSNCPNCGKRFKSLTKHLERSTCGYKGPPIFFKCDKCSENFRFEWKRNRHAQSCNKKYACDHCNVRFDSKYKIRMHILKKHRN